MARNVKMLSARMLALAVMGVAISGCVPQEKYNALKLERDRYAEQLATAQTEAAAQKSQADAYKSQLDAMLGQGGTKDSLVQNLMNQNSELQRQLDDINRRYNDAMGKAGENGVALPPALDSAIREFAKLHGGELTYDPVHGVVKFNSDVTFASGQATLTGRAKSTIDQFAGILNSTDADGYEVIVAGHTDNTRVVNPATIKAGHFDNWYLSAHRAISVANEMMGQRVGAQRIAVTGYADQRPMASNTSEAGKAQNRRVEVLILPTTVKTGLVEPAAAPRRTPGVTKKATGTPARSAPAGAK